MTWFIQGQNYVSTNKKAFYDVNQLPDDIIVVTEYYWWKTNGFDGHSLTFMIIFWGESFLLE